MGGRECLDVHRSGQFLFLPHAWLKQRKQASSGHDVFSIAVTYKGKGADCLSLLAKILSHRRCLILSRVESS